MNESEVTEAVKPIRVIYSGLGSEEVFHGVHSVQVESGALWLNSADGEFLAVIAKGQWVQAVSEEA